MTFQSVSYGPCSHTGVVCWLRFRRDNLVVDDRQMVSLVSVYGRGSLFDIYIYSLLHFSLVTVGFMGQYFSVLHGSKRRTH